MNDAGGAPAPQSQDQVQRGLLLDVVVGQFNNHPAAGEPNELSIPSGCCSPPRAVGIPTIRPNLLDVYKEIILS